VNTPANNPYFGSRLLRLTTPNQKGADVRILQALLNMLAGVVFRDRLVEDGIFGPITRNAVRDFQRYFGLTVDGVVGQETYYRLGHRIGKYAVGEPIFSSRTLQNGARGEDVRVLQNRLSAFKKGYLNRPSDGRYMYFTQEAVLMFQLDFPNLEPDSIVKADTYEKIFIHAPLGGRNLRLNLHGLDTYWLQYYLYQLNFYNRQPNGFFDQATAAAVSSFQRSADITVDGIVGPQTYLALGTSIAFPQKEYYYRIMIGDSVFKIAQLFGKDIEEIIRLNNITPPNYTIFPGQLLKIPLPLNFHLAQKDETLESVASLYSLTADKLAQANNMVPTSSLLPDETIVLPNYNRALQGKVVFLKQTD
jgi:peptidoglycan hydrolase-like protein with peptidoglycan-binding domain/LysM repeat protein